MRIDTNSCELEPASTQHAASTQPASAIDIDDAFTCAKGYARRIAGARLHPDDSESAAGLAVVKAMRCHDPSKGGSFKTLLFIFVRREVIDDIRKNRRYVGMPEGYFDSMPGATSSPVTEQDIAEVTPRDLAEAGATIEQIAMHFGMSRRQARRIFQEHSPRSREATASRQAAVGQPSEARRSARIKRSSRLWRSKNAGAANATNRGDQ